MQAFVFWELVVFSIVSCQLRSKRARIELSVKFACSRFFAKNIFRSTMCCFIKGMMSVSRGFLRCASQRAFF
jgi:hypothetical protein